MVEAISFPVRLEFGQQFTVSFRLIPANIDMFGRLIEKDPEATIKAVVTTTLSERVESTPYSLLPISHCSF